MKGEAGLVTRRGYPRIRTCLVGFTQDEWQRIRLAATVLLMTEAAAGALILPGRPELYQLDEKGGHYELRLSSEEQLTATLREETKR